MWSNPDSNVHLGSDKIFWIPDGRCNLCPKCTLECKTAHNLPERPERIEQPPSANSFQACSPA